MRYVITYYDVDGYIQAVEISGCNPIHAIQVFQETENQDNIISLILKNF